MSQDSASASKIMLVISSAAYDDDLRFRVCLTPTVLRGIVALAEVQGQTGDGSIEFVEDDPTMPCTSDSEFTEFIVNEIGEADSYEAVRRHLEGRGTE
jgi:hypothetical protein